MGFIAYVVQRGTEARVLCDEAGIDLNYLLQNPHAELNDAELQKLWMSAVRLTGDPLFGLHFGESFQLAALGAVGEIIKSSETVGAALTLASGFISVVTNLYTMVVDKNKQTFTIAFHRTREEPEDVARQIADFLMVFTVHELNGFLLRKVTPTTISYAFPINAHSEYERIFRCIPVTKHNELKISFDASFADEPIITANFEHQRFFLEKVAASHPASASSFQARIMDYLLRNAYHGIPSLDDVAANYNITPRSLQRRLQEEGTSFQQTVDTVRKNLATHYLESGKYKVKEISSLLGYNELSAFSRAFKRWTGKTPIDYSA